MTASVESRNYKVAELIAEGAESTEGGGAWGEGVSSPGGGVWEIFLGILHSLCNAAIRCIFIDFLSAVLQSLLCCSTIVHVYCA